jgi:hypothetical protein
MRKALFVLLLLAFVASASAQQYYLYNGTARDAAGTALVSPSVLVTLVPPAGVASIYTDAGTTPKANPFTAAADGTYSFYAVAGRYQVDATKSGFTYTTFASLPSGSSTVNLTSLQGVCVAPSGTLTVVWDTSGNASCAVGGGGGGMVYPGAGVANSTGAAWGTSYTVGTGANNLVQLNGSSQLPAVSAALLTAFPTLNQSTSGNAATATAMAALGTPCSAGQGATGVDVSGNAVGCTTYVELAGDLGNTAASPQVTATHLLSALPIAQGGTASTTATGSGVVVLATSPTITTPTISGAIGGNFDLGTQADLYEIANEGATGTTVNKLAKLTGAPSTAIVTTTGDLTGISGVVVAGAGIAGNAQLARAGRASCVFDGATTAGDYVQGSATVAGDCHDAGASLPTSNQILGRVLSTNGGGGTYAMTVYSPGINGAAASGLGGSTGATDKAVLIANGTGGATLQNSGVTSDANGDLYMSGAATAVLGIGGSSSSFAGLWTRSGSTSQLVLGLADRSATTLAWTGSLYVTGAVGTGPDVFVQSGSSGRLSVAPGGIIGFSSSGGADNTDDTALGRASAGIMTVDTSTPRNFQGAMKMAKLYIDYTNTGTVGAVTINKAAGRVNIAASGTSVVVTDSVVTAASHVFGVISTNDATATLKNIVPAAGSFTITLTAATTAQTSIDFFVVNAD